MKIIIKKVFSQKIAKSYYLTQVEHPPISGLPCYSLREAGYIKENNPSVEELEFIYKQKLENHAYSFLPEEKSLKQGDIVEKKETISEATQRALRECMEFIENMKPIDLLEEEEKSKPRSEEYWQNMGNLFTQMIKPTFLIQSSFLASKRDQILLKRKK
jgi:hypothetical protein